MRLINNPINGIFHYDQGALKPETKLLILQGLKIGTSSLKFVYKLLFSAG